MQMLHISINIPSNGQLDYKLQLSQWRPGRYETSNYPKNITNLQLILADGTKGLVEKTESHTYLCHTGGQEATLAYTYFANQPDAGGSFVDASWVYVNPINCIMFPCNDDQNQPITLNLSGINLKQIIIEADEIDTKIYSFQTFDELFDTPFILADYFDKLHYQVADIKFTIALFGNYFTDHQRVLSNFKEFTKVQIDLFKEFPTNRFTFIIIALPFAYYHGVEHTKCTVIVLGPASEINQTPIYNELVGVSSHELFHVWNIKTIRPMELLPYQFNQKQYSKMGYVYEGFTTYYGDLMLARSGFFDLRQYLTEINNYLKKHWFNDGRSIASMHNASIDTWVDGYGATTPGRRVSIYAEGLLHAFYIDLKIRKTTRNKFSLDNVMQWLHQTYGNLKAGYTERELFETIANLTQCESWLHYPSDFLQKAVCFENVLPDVIDWVGLSLIDSEQAPETRFGIRLQNLNGVTSIMNLDTASELAKAGASPGCVINQINNRKFNPDKPQTWSNIFNESSQIIVSWTNHIKQPQITVCEPYEHSPFVQKHLAVSLNTNKEQKHNRDKWLGK